MTRKLFSIERQRGGAATSGRLRTIFRLLLWPGVGLLAGVLTAGCASVRPPELDLRDAAIVVRADDPKPSMGRDGGLLFENDGVDYGARLGLGGGLGLAALCGLAGPAALPCVAVVVPASMTVGAAGGAALNAVREDPAEASRNAVGSELAKMSPTEILAERMQRKAREIFQVEVPLLAETAAVDSMEQQWLIGLALTNVSLRKQGVVEYLVKPVLHLQVAGRITLRRAADPQLVYQKVLVATDPGKALTMAEWDAGGGAMLRARLDQQLDVLAELMLVDIQRTAAAIARRRAGP